MGLGIGNELLEEVVMAGRITTYKIHLDRFVNRSLEGSGSNAGKQDQSRKTALLAWTGWAEDLFQCCMTLQQSF